MRNAINQARRCERLAGNAVTMEAYFAAMKVDNSDFFSAMETDNEGRLKNVFWADARCRALAKAFSDAVMFDTTFLCNRYRMPFAPFISVNHHGCSILLGSALITNEDADSFGWVFDRWLECMGKAPSVILTDQDKAIGKAIKHVFPNTPHRLCIWHIMKNAARNLGSYNQWTEIEPDLKAVVHDSMDQMEFEEAWSEMVKKYGLEENSWIRDSFEIRDRWVPAYWRGTFCAGMSSTQRSEQQNRFFKGYVSLESGLKVFINQFENALKAKVVEEKMMNLDCINKPPRYNKNILVEEVFHKLYTNTMFKEVQYEAYGLLHTNVTLVAKFGSYARYNADEKVVNPFWKGRKSFDVTIDANAGEFSCSCKLFEFKGILCKHIIRCIELQDIRFIPEKYILDRWRKDLVRDYEHIRIGYYDPDESRRVKRSLEVSIKNQNIAKLALQDDETYAIYTRASDELCKELEACIGIDTFHSSTAEFSTRVWCRRRLQPKENNERCIAKNIIPIEGGVKDPIDKRVGGHPIPSKGTQSQAREEEEGK